MKRHWLKVLSLVIPISACSSDESSNALTTDTSADGAVEGDSAGSDSTDSDATGHDGDSTDGTDGGVTDGDVTDGDMTVKPTTPTFVFGTDPAQTVSLAPFPNDLYVAADGTLDVAPLASDPILSTLAKPEILTSWDAQIDLRKGFGSGMPIWLFASSGSAADLASFADKVEIVVLDGPEKGRTVKPQIFWSAPAGALGVFPAWGDYLMAESTVAVIVRAGGKDSEGEAFEAFSREQALALPRIAPYDAFALWLHANRFRLEA